VVRSTLRERAIEELVTLTLSDDAQLRANALEAFLPARSRLKPVVASALADENEGVRAIAAVVAGRAELDGLETTLHRLSHDPSPYVQSGAIYALRTIGVDVDATPLGSLLLEHPDPLVRAHAAFLIGEMGEESALPMLRQALHADPSGFTPQERRLLELQVAEAMVKLGDDSRLPGIRAALYPAHPEEFETATLAVQILGRLEDRGAIPALINLSKYRQGGRGMPPEVRLAVAEAVARMGRREGWFIAEAYVEDPDPRVRAQAAVVLGQTARDEDLATLAGMLEDPSGYVRSAAGGAVLRATSPGGSSAQAGASR
jgi:HEAT repeat protein